MICVSCWISACYPATHAYSVTFKTHFFIPFCRQLILITIQIVPHGSSICFFPLSSFILPDPAPFIILMQQKWRKKNSRSHFIICCCVPKHISSLKHLDISVIEHFSPLLVKYASPPGVCVCVRKKDIKCVCVCAHWHLPDTFMRVSVMYNLVNWNGVEIGLSMDQ